MNNLLTVAWYPWCGSNAQRKSPYIALGLLLLMSLLFSASLRAQTCERLILPHNPPMGKFNPDSVMVDTCSNEIFAKRCFFIILKKDYFEIPQTNIRDTFVVRDWIDLDSSLVSLRNAFNQIENKFGTFLIQKKFPDIVDTMSIGSKLFYFHFNEYEIVDSVQKSVTQLLADFHESKCFFESTYYEDPSVNPPPPNWSPPLESSEIENFEFRMDQNIVGKDPTTNQHRRSGLIANEINSSQDVKKNKLGFSWNLFLLKIPIAWEITHGSNKIVYAIVDPHFTYNSYSPGHGETGLFPSGDFVSKNTYNGNGNWYVSENKGQGTTKFYDKNHSHGFMMASVFNARKNNKGVVGIAPGCTVTGIENALINQIDINPSNSTVDPPDGLFCGNQSAQVDANAFLNRGIPVFGAHTIGDAHNPSVGRKQLSNLSPEEFTFSGIINPRPINEGASFHFGLPMREFTFQSECRKEENICTISLPWDLKSAINSASGDYDYYSSNYKDQLCQLSGINGRNSIFSGFALLDPNDPNRAISYVGTLNSAPSLLIPNGGIFFNATDLIAVQDYGASMSFTLGQTAGVCALMQSVDRQVALANPEIADKSWRISERIFDIMTYTAKKLYIDYNTKINQNGTEKSAIYDIYASVPTPAGGRISIDSVTESTVVGGLVDKMKHAYDPLARSFSQIVGFGLLDAFRSVAHSIPHKPNGATTSNVRYKYESNNSLDWSNAALLDKDIHTLNAVNRKVLHLGKYYDATTELLGVDTWSRGGHVFRKGILQEPIYKNGNGKTIVNTTLNVGGSATEEQVLAIDGIMTSDNTQGGKIQTTTNSTGKILATGYLDNVIYEGNVKLSDLKIIGDDGKAGITFKAPANKQGEIYGEVMLYEHGFMNCESGKTVIRPGGIVRMKGTKDIVVKSGAVLEMDYASEIYSDLASGQKTRKIIVEDGGVLRIPERARAVILDCIVEIKKGGKFIMEEQSAAFINQFFVDSASLFLLKKGTTLQLGPTVSECRGHFVSYGKENHWDETPDAPVSNPVPGFDERVIITGKKSYCGEPDITSRINFDYDLGQLPADPALVNATDKLPLLKKLGASFKMKYTNVSNVSLNIKNVYMEKLEFNKFDANQNLVAIEGINSISGKKYFDAVNISYIFDNETYFNKWNNAIDRGRRNNALRKMSFGTVEVSDCQFTQGDEPTGDNTNLWKRREALNYNGLNIFVRNGIVLSETNIHDNSFSGWLSGLTINSNRRYRCEDNIFGENSFGLSLETTYGLICNNMFNLNRYGIQSRSTTTHFTLNNTFANCGYGADFWGSSLQKIRNNTFSNDALGVAMRNSIVDLTGMEIVYRNSTLQKKIYGRNSFSYNISLSVFDEGARAKSDILYLTRNDYSYLRCGLNDMTRQGKTHLKKALPEEIEAADNFPLRTGINVHRNNWKDVGNPVVRRETVALVPITEETQLNLSAAAETSCDPLYAEECIPSGILIEENPGNPPYPYASAIRFENTLTGVQDDWSTKERHTQQEWNNLLPIVLHDMKDTSLDILNRKERMFDAFQLIRIADTSTNRSWVDSVSAALTSIVNDSVEDLYVRNSALKLRAMVHEEIGNYDEARLDYLDMLNHYHELPDSIHAVWGLQRTTAHIMDTTRGKVYDSLMLLYRYRVMKDRMLLDEGTDTSQYQKRGDRALTGSNISPFSLSTLRPHPVTQHSECTLHLNEQCHVNIEIQTITGAKALTLSNGILDKGSHTIAILGNTLSSGVYILSVQTSCGTVSRYFIITQ